MKTVSFLYIIIFDFKRKTVELIKTIIEDKIYTAKIIIDRDI